MADRISMEHLARLYRQAVSETSTIDDSEELRRGFVCGFRCYERMATALAVELSDADARRFIPISESDSATTEHAAPIDGAWLRQIGFTYHAIGRYYYRNTINDIILVEAKESEDEPDVQWWLSRVGGQIDPADYTELAGQLSGRASREDVEAVVDICERELNVV